MTSFEPGDLCWLYLTQDSDHPEWNGYECIVTGAREWTTFDDGTADWAYPIDIIGVPGDFLALPDALVKQPPHDTKLARWDQCPFKPKQVNA